MSGRKRKLMWKIVPNVNDDLIQPLIPQPTPPDDAYVVTDTDLTLDENLEEFEDEILDITMVDEEADFIPTRDIEELERLITDHESSFTEIKVDARGVVLGWLLASRKPFKTGLVGCFTDDDDELFMIVNVA
uniref:Uncharacterized protein n=1 Tax=Tanacetum cinerariifolium TaxID=118510 RepID=A0A6L2KIE2_TANCI|nr:hypothetical protein [Tanacetum cinerariifolium]